MTKFVFIDNKHRLLTQRIDQTDCKPTVAWLGMMRPDLNLLDNMVGSTGLANSSANIDLVYDRTLASPDELFEMFVRWAKSYDKHPSHFVKRSQNIVYFKCPINGMPVRGFVQVNLYPVHDVEYSRFMMRLAAESQYKCRERNILLNSIAYTAGFELSPLRGLTKDERVVTRDPQRICNLLLGDAARIRDVATVEAILAVLAGDARRMIKLEKFLLHLEEQGIPFVDPHYVPEVHFMARLRDRIINQGLQPIFESRARIEHLEDLVFERGVRGIYEALDIIDYSTRYAPEALEAKLDGKPGIIFGRKEDGAFILTDKAGFNAKGYNGMTVCPEQIEAMLEARGPGRKDLIEIYKKIFPILDAATPTNFRGFVQGDLMFSEKPEIINGHHVFRPNFIEYKIPQKSDLGTRIDNSEVGIALHTLLRDRLSEGEPLGEFVYNDVPGLLFIRASDFPVKRINNDHETVAQIKDILAENEDYIKRLFDPVELKSRRLTDLPKMCKKFINTRIDSNFDDLLTGFLDWLKENLSDKRFNRVIDYLKTPFTNIDGICAAFTIFLLLHDLKMHALNQLAEQHEGHEGWVANTPAGQAKLVDRFEFSASNRKHNAK